MAIPEQCSNSAFWQPLIASAGAFAVAALTVWGSHHGAQRREEANAERQRMTSRRAVLQEKLENLVNLVERHYRVSQRSQAQFISLRSHLEQGMVPTLHPEPEEPVVSPMDEALVLARLYFPTLTEPLEKLKAALFEYGSFFADESADLANDFAVWNAGPALTLQERSAAACGPAVRLRFDVLTEASRLVQSEFSSA